MSDDDRRALATKMAAEIETHLDQLRYCETGLLGIVLLNVAGAHAVIERIPRDVFVDSAAEIYDRFLPLVQKGADA
jgi:hypothetical protein